MLLKKLLIILCISSTILLSSCREGTNLQYNQTNNIEQEIDNHAHKINSSSYTDDAIKIFYPQLSGMSDITKQGKINDSIKSEALQTLDCYDDKDNLSADINYDIKFDNSKLLSIAYTGVIHPNKASYPLNVFYTTNLDLYTFEKLRLTDFVEINDDLIKKFKEAKYIAWDSELNSAEELIKKDISTYDLSEVLKNSDDISEKNSANAFSYITNDSIGISLGVIHAIGDHAEFEITYLDIKDYLKYNNK